MELLTQLQQNVLGGGELTRSDAPPLAREDPDKLAHTLAHTVDEIRE